MRAAHTRLGIQTESWSPLGQGLLLANETVGEVARKLGKTPAQVIIRWHIQHGLVVLAHRFGWLLNAGDVDEMPVNVTHSCDNPLCQNPAHFRDGTWSSNRVEYVQRRGTPTSPLRDVRGARGRALALREAARLSADVKAAADAGLSELDRHQATLW